MTGGKTMKNTWRKLMAAFCAAAMLITLPGVSAYAADSANEDSIGSYEEIDAETIEPSSEGEAQPEIAEESAQERIPLRRVNGGGNQHDQGGDKNPE